jgi:hypothetical protein
MGMFNELRRAKELGLNLTAGLVKAYVNEHGYAPIGQIARACDVSILSVVRAIAALKASSFLKNQKTTSMTHDHDIHFSKNNRTASVVTGVSDDAVATQNPVAAHHAADPLAMKLLEADVLPWCVDIILNRVDRAVIERQLAFHQHRVASGYRFKSHPAKFLFAACLNDYMPPQDYHAARQRPETATMTAPRSRAAGRVAAAEPEPVSVVEEAPVEMTRSGALTVIRMGVRSKLPTMRQEAIRLARVWSVDLRELGAPPDLLAEAAG